MPNSPPPPLRLEHPITFNDALSFTVLDGRVGAGHAQVDAIGQQESAGTRVVKLFAVVALNGLDGGVELGAHISKEIG